jgi:hypothetical protein
MSDVMLYGSPLLIAIFFKELIAEFISGLLWRFGSHIEADDVIKFNGKWGRIARIGLVKTTIYLYDIDSQNRIIGGCSMCLLNSELRKEKICEPLRLINEPTKLNPIS